MANKDYSKLPMDILLTNISNKVKGIQFFKTNLTYPLKSGDTLKVRAFSSAEISYFLRKADSDLNTTIAEPYMLSAIAYFKDEDVDPVNFIGNTITTVQGTTLEYVEATLNVPVELNGTPKVYLVRDDVDYIYGTITVDSGDPYKVIITPDGSNGISADLGVFTLKVEADSVRYGTFGNDEILIQLTVVEQ